MKQPGVTKALREWVQTQGEFDTRQAADEMLRQLPDQPEKYMRMYVSRVLFLMQRSGKLQVVRRGNHETPNVWRVV